MTTEPISSPQAMTPRLDQWLAVRLQHATQALGESVEVNPAIRGGIPVVRGTRFPVARVLAELADGLSLSQIADDFDLDISTLRQVVESFSILLDRPTQE